ncbi:hypothetical protein Leryth_012099 [Lithospermum erythrorhizon]|nr:hypothetical protein Leryth_012099 [Lithospermum erythrorhizon]
MSACRSLQHIFDKQLPENKTLLESLSSWSPIKSMKPVDNSSFTELFGELHFQENHHGEPNAPPSSSSPYPASPPSSVSSSSSSLSDSNNHQLTGIERLFRENTKTPFSPTCYYPSKTSQKKQYMHGDSFSSMSSEGLSHCTEGLGFESSDEVEELGNENISLDSRYPREDKQGEYMHFDHKRSRVNRGTFPPPISCIGSNGKPFINFKSCRENGRFVLSEVRIPQQEFLRASRENGRLKLQLVHSDDEMDYDEDFDLNDIQEVDEDIKEDDSVNEEEGEKEFHEIIVNAIEQDQINNDMYMEDT